MNSEDYILSQLIASGILPPPVSTATVNISKPGFQFQYHAYDDEVEILSILHGTSYVGINNRFIRIQKNDCLIIFPKVNHNYFLKEKESCKMIDLVFKPGDLSTFTESDLYNNLAFLHQLVRPNLEFLRFVDDGSIRSVLENILAQYDHPSQSSQMLLKLYYCQLYVLLSRAIATALIEENKVKNRHVYQGLELMVNFFSTHLTVEEIARQVGVSTRHFSRLFVEEMGMNVPDYLTILRIRKAKELLTSSNLDITHIAYTVGFNSSQYFITSFKRLEHVTPKIYRNMMKNRESSREIDGNLTTGSR